MNKIKENFRKNKMNMELLLKKKNISVREKSLNFRSSPVFFIFFKHLDEKGIKNG